MIHLEKKLENGTTVRLTEKIKGVYGISILNKENIETDYLWNLSATKTFESTKQWFNRLN